MNEDKKESSEELSWDLTAEDFEISGDLDDLPV